MAGAIPRLAPARPLPPYAYLPGRGPHPSRDPAGHRYGRDDADFGPPPGEPGEPAGAGPESWFYALDLYNHGFHWEAHEALEAWWRAVAPADPRRPFFHGLLRLAAARVKLGEGRPAGASRHAARAASLLEDAALRLGGDRTLLGLRPRDLAARARALAEAAARTATDPATPLPDHLLGPILPDPAGG